MIYAVEGNVNVGKTTFIKNFAKVHHLNIIEESKFESRLTPLERQNYYIDQEIEKYKRLFNKNIIMDRTILSVYLYTFISNEFKIEERQQLLNRINNVIKDGRIIIPNKLFFILYPFELINKNHILLGNQKNTQEQLVDYNYYLKYNMFFTNLLKNTNHKIYSTKNNRQIIEIDDCSIYYNLKDTLSKAEDVIIIDEVKDNVTFEDTSYSQKIGRIINKVININKDGQIIHNSFILDIINLLENLTKEQKIQSINYIMNKVPLYHHISQIIYINDSKAKSFYNVLLIDLFYYIKDCIEKDEI